MQIENKIKEFILKNLYFTEDNTLDDEASFLETGVVDSTGVMELVAFIEAEFGAKTEPEEIVVENFDSVRKVARFVRRKLAVSEPQSVPARTAVETEGTAVANR